MFLQERVQEINDQLKKLQGGGGCGSLGSRGSYGETF